MFWLFGLVAAGALITLAEGANKKKKNNNDKLVSKPVSKPIGQPIKTKEQIFTEHRRELLEKFENSADKKGVESFFIVTKSLVDHSVYPKENIFNQIKNEFKPL